MSSHSDESTAQLEAVIRAARNYVVPSENLRPRTLEAARDFCRDRASNLRFRKFALLLFVGSLLSMPLIDRLIAWRENSLAPSAYELQQRGLNLASQSNIGPHWGLLEAFTELRQDQASRLSRSRNP